MTNDLVSVILPCYNVEKYIAKSIQSVLDQTYGDFELLVIIDGSPDNSKGIAESFDDPRIKIYEKTNGGLSDARNHGLERAKGEYVYFLDSDDWIESNLLEDNLKLIIEGNLDFIVFGYVQDDEDEAGKVMARTEVKPRVSAYIRDADVSNIDLYHIGLMGYAWNKIYNKSFLDKNNFRFIKGISLVEDILFNSEIYFNSDRIQFNPSTYYHYINRQEETLMKRFYNDSFELKVKKNIALDHFLTAWSIQNRKSLLAESLFLGMKYCILNLVNSDTATTMKYKLLREMCTHPRVKALFKYYNPILLKDRILLYLIRVKSVRIINFLRMVK